MNKTVFDLERGDSDLKRDTVLIFKQQQQQQQIYLP